MVVYLVVNGLLFAFLWLLEIFNSLRAGVIPPSGGDLGFVINPVHVLDLGFILPAMIIVASLLYKRRVNGYLFAVPIITFAVTMGLAIVSMVLMMHVRELTSSWVPAIGMMVNAVLGIIIGASFLKSLQRLS